MGWTAAPERHVGLPGSQDRQHLAPLSTLVEFTPLHAAMAGQATTLALRAAESGSSRSSRLAALGRRRVSWLRCGPRRVMR